VRAAAVIALVLAAILTLGAAGLHAAARPKPVFAAVQLAPENGSGVRGAAFFRQQGRALSGWVVVWGLEPGTAHAVHFHGPSGRCGAPPPPKPAVAAHADLVADARGVAFRSFRTQSAVQVIRRGFYYNVHSRPVAAGTSPSISCADLRPAR
jgi:hypothetical protein